MRCLCHRCRPKTLREIAPRIALAQEQLIAELQWKARRRRWLRDRLWRAQWTVDHRDLQLQRAQATGDARYIARRQAKLQRAQKELRRLQRRMQEVAA